MVWTQDLGTEEAWTADDGAGGVWTVLIPGNCEQGHWRIILPNYEFVSLRFLGRRFACHFADMLQAGRVLLGA